MNLWHDIEPGTENEINVIVEVPSGSQNKYEIDKDTGIIALDRANYSSAAYPCDYGFVPKTLWDDGDALDVLVLSSFAIPPGILVRVRPIGIMEMVDTGEQDHKLIGVPVKDKRWDNVKDISDVNPHTLHEVKHFFETYKQLKGDAVLVPGFKGAKDAKEAFHRGITMYNEKFSK